MSIIIYRSYHGIKYTFVHFRVTYPQDNPDNVPRVHVAFEPGVLPPTALQRERGARHVRLLAQTQTVAAVRTGHAQQATDR